LSEQAEPVEPNDVAIPVNNPDVDRVNQKYKDLKSHYKNLLSSFDQSEDLRKIYKKLVID